MKLRSWLTASLAIIALGLGGCASTAPAPAPIADTAARAPQLTTLNRLITEAGLTETLRGSGPYTMFAPSDEAFKSMPAGALEALSKDKEKLKALLSYHVLPNRLASADVHNGNARTLQGADVALSKAGTFVTIEDAIVTQPDMPAANGVVHVIDRVLTPPKKH
jgi:uncharacterized surface protein with fasciclin (FAS1) repeats